MKYLSKSKPCCMSVIKFNPLLMINTFRPVPFTSCPAASFKDKAFYAFVSFFAENILRATLGKRILIGFAKPCRHVLNELFAVHLAKFKPVLLIDYITFSAFAIDYHHFSP